MSHQICTNASVTYADGSCANKRSDKRVSCPRNLTDLMYPLISITQPLLYMILGIVFHKNSYQNFTPVHPLSCGHKNVNTMQYLPLCLFGSLLYSPRCIFLSFLSNPIDSNALQSYQESNTNKICSLTHTKYSQVNTHFFVYRSFCISHMNCLT